jgi:hypothetical protein
LFAGQNVGVKQIGDQMWLVSFMQYDENPFGAKVLPMCPE